MPGNRERGRLDQLDQLRRSLQAITEQPARLRQLEQVRRSLDAIVDNAWLRQQDQLRRSLEAIAEQPAWLRQQGQLRSTLALLGDATATEPLTWLDRIGSADVGARALEFVDDGFLLPSEAIQEPLITGAFEGDELGLLNALPHIYNASSPALRRKLNLAVAALALATAFYIVALAHHHVEQAAETALTALLSLWAVYNAFLEMTDELEVESNDSDAEPD